MPPSKRQPAEEKASDSIRLRIGGGLKEQLQDALKRHPNFSGEFSEFYVDCAKAFVLQMRQGQPPAYPLEFVAEQAAPTPPR